MAAPIQSYLLDGNSDYITLVDHADFDAGTYLSLGMWFRPDYDVANDAYLYHRQSTFSMYLTQNKRVAFFISGAGTLISSSPIVVEKKNFVVCTAAESGSDLLMKIYIDGVLDTSSTLYSAAMPAAAATGVYIGAFETPANYLKGTVSSIFMTNDLVTGAEVATIFGHASGQATGNINALVIDIDTEGDLVNAGTAGNGTAQGTAVARTYMDFGQQDVNVWHIPAAEAGYNTQKKVILSQIEHLGDDIADGSQVTIKDWADNVIWDHYAFAAHQGEVKYFAAGGEIFQGLKIVTLGAGQLLINIL
ncbi:hypothetical protein LCGC14_2566070 [marine sediment metagenome]|uniref:LamG-like jellyroll fold domain-containing protein n=1 Tax=marine sediment metagenome TaxID=412755 RepID=A0A0F9AIJ9_9ZZZZ